MKEITKKHRAINTIKFVIINIVVYIFTVIVTSICYDTILVDRSSEFFIRSIFAVFTLIVFTSYTALLVYTIRKKVTGFFWLIIPFVINTYIMLIATTDALSGIGTESGGLLGAMLVILGLVASPILILIGFIIDVKSKSKTQPNPPEKDNFSREPDISLDMRTNVDFFSDSDDDSDIDIDSDTDTDSDMDMDIDID